ncbi:MAG: 30S ribosomal protein S4 [Candidatus Omnitrophota bacterium]|jgi:small subunit ribosomal protein S4
MARYTGAVCRLCRRQGEKLFLKGARCLTEKCSITRREYAPGDHGQGRSKASNYGLQLKEKQKVKRIYGVMERQFRKYFSMATKTKGVTGKILLQLLERRIDNVIFKLGMASSRAQARQIVRHNHVYINSQRVNIPSFLVKKDDIVEVKGKEKAVNGIKENLKASADRSVPAWLDLSKEKMQAKIVRLPEREEVQHPIQEQLIVELYSK